MKKVQYTLTGHTDTITSLAVSPDTQSLLSNSHDSTVRVWDVRPFAPADRAVKTYDGAHGGLEKNLFRTTGISDVALGQIDAVSAESGIALQIRMAPLLDAAAEKDLEIDAVMNQMLFDLRAWFQVYESVNLDNTSVTSTFGEKLPVNRSAHTTWC